MRVLITNDDGIESTGIRVLASVAVAAGLDVTVAAPSWDSSGASASLTAVEEDGRFVLDERHWDDVGVEQALAVEAAPAFIVRAAVHGAFGEPPDVVLSGVNHGSNAGRAVLHSGTVGAALTAYTNGRRAAAVSIQDHDAVHWDTAAEVASTVLDWLLGADGPVVLNVNVPNVAPGELRGLAEARLASFGAVQTMVTERGKGYVKLRYTDVGHEPEEGTDVGYLRAGSACFTPLEAVCEATDRPVVGLARGAEHEPGRAVSS